MRSWSRLMSSLDLLVEAAVTPVPRHRAAGIAGMGTALPAAAVETTDIAAQVGVEPEWILRRTGIASRRRLPAGATLTDLAIDAAQTAIDDARVDAAALDAVLVATATADEIMPAAAPLVAHALGAGRAMAWDVNLACTGFLAGLEQGAALIESGRADTVLVIAAEALSRLTDHTDRKTAALTAHTARKTAALFGDGAGAAVLTAGGPLRLGRSVLRAEGDEHGSLVV